MKLLISDFEGTLVDFQWKLKDSMEEMWEILKEYNVNYNLNLPIKKLKKYDYAKLYNYFQDNIDNPKLKSKIIADFDRVYDFYDEDAASRWKLKKDVKDTLERLMDNNVKIALCSNVGLKALKRVLKKFSLENYFEIIISRDDVSFLKPNIEGIQKILNFFQPQPEKIFFLGDSITDIHTAKSANICSIIIVGEGENNIEEINKYKPDYIIDDIKQLLKYIH